MSTYLGVNACLALCLNRFLNAKAVVAAFNQLKAFSMIVQLHQLIVNSSKTEASLHNFV